MTTLTVNINNENDLPILKEILDRFGLAYQVDEQYDFTEAEIKGFLKTQQDFIDGKTTARNWQEIQDDLDRVYS
jgi:coproporphyrinogen III oxidase-like Fe-S oxidoreductase